MIKKSPNATAYRNAKKIAKELYENGVTDAEAIARNVGVQPRTVKKWIKNDCWITREEDSKDMREKMLAAADAALLKAFERFKDEPFNKDLQSLNSMFNRFLERMKPDKKILEYIIKFQADVIEFCMQSGNETLRKHYQAVLMELSEFLREKYV